MMPPRAPLPTIDPSDCTGRLAIVVRYRNRPQHLSALLLNRVVPG